eukprot:scaffold13347_cov188-Alexandrium_tamarense.AAC.10
MFSAVSRSVASSAIRRVAARSSNGARAASCIKVLDTTAHSLPVCCLQRIFTILSTRLCQQSTAVRASAAPAAKLSGLALVAASSAFIASTQFENNKVVACDALPVHGIAGTNQERTFLAVKPDGVQRGLVGDIIARFEKRGYKLVGLKMVWPTLEMAQIHYKDLAKKPFYGSLCKFFSSGP